jgi:diguanylate cyclase (GGDEF)-like protein
MHPSSPPARPPAQSTLPRLLIVDDQPANIELIHQIFRGQFQVFVALCGEQAIKLCADNPPDIVLMDVVMPGIGGLAACRLLHQAEATREVPIIFVTSGRETEEEEACWDAGAVDFVSRPVLATTLRNRVRVHLMLKRQSDQLRALAYVDGLTGIANRRCFDERFLAEWQRCQRNGEDLSLILVDVDFFKLYNDHYGHQAGDDCLRTLSATLKANLVRPMDLIARYGGEEFVCLLPATSYEGACVVANVLEGAARKLHIDHVFPNDSSSVTISLGVASVAVSAGQSMSALLELADQQLYQAKKAGRGRVCGARLKVADQGKVRQPSAADATTPP